MAGMTDCFELECLLSGPSRDAGVELICRSQRYDWVYTASLKRSAAIEFDSDSAAVVDAELPEEQPEVWISRFDESGKGWQCPLSEFAIFAISALTVALQTGMEPRKQQPRKCSRCVGSRVGLFMLAGKRHRVDFYDAVSLAANKNDAA